MRSSPVLLCAGVLLAGCVPQSFVSFTRTSTPPAAVELLSSSITLPMGIAVAVKAHPQIDSEAVPAATPLTMTPRDSGIIGIRPGSGKDRPFVIFGIKESTTVIDVQVGDAAPAHITANVTAAQ